jgi:hypothetical protein
MKETEHDYQGCLCGNWHDSNMNGILGSWQEFKTTHAGFCGDGYDDTYNFVFRYDIHKQDGLYSLELCIMLQRKGIYTHLYVKNITQAELDTDVKAWLIGRKQYIDSLWDVKEEKARLMSDED